MTTKQLICSPTQAQDLTSRFRVVKQSIDARQRELKVHLTFLVDEQGRYISRDAKIPLYDAPRFNDVHAAEHSVYIIGAGPAGLFAALTLLEKGVKPIIFERGKEVGERKIDIAKLNRNIQFNPESNYCFGEGGAGTFSDGKLFSRSKKRGNMQRVMELFHYFGAPDTVLYESHAHIGSDKLPSIIRAMRHCIVEHGGEIHFSSTLLSLRDLCAQPTILGIGHSAHDTYRMLFAEGVQVETKGFAMGVRVEHPQSLINRLMYHNQPQSIIDIVGNASYSLVTQVTMPSPHSSTRSRGVYSFCMCPGGHIVPASSNFESCVVNGMSASHRNSPYANSGIVVELQPDDLPTSGPLAGIEFQEQLESLAFRQGGAPAVAPAQRLVDFVEGSESKTLPMCSYLPGLCPSRLDQWLPDPIGYCLRQGFRDFGRKYAGYLTNDAVVVGVESRSSSPLRIVRNPERLCSVSTPWLYPVGEGAGYAGGITSSALDGIRAAEQLVINCAF